MGWLLTSIISLSRICGSGGENCQCRVALPALTAQKPIRATRNSPGPQPVGQLLKAPEAKAMLPGSVYTPRSMQAPGPLQTSFCRTASKVVVSALTVVDTGMDEQVVLVTGTTFSTDEGEDGSSNSR